jgi:hypothetical protein
MWRSDDSVAIKSYMRVEVFSWVYQYEADAATTITAPRKFPSIHNRDLVIQCVFRIMNDSIDAGLLASLARLKFVASTCGHGKALREVKIPLN